jgi:N-acetylmuramoyl-L-alanine amidase
MKTLFAKMIRLLGGVTLGVALHTIVIPLVATDAEAACVTGVASNDVLNIRNGPGAKYNIVGSIRPGECGVVTGRRSGNWVWVDYGYGGYVHSRYLRSEDEGGDASDQRCVRGVASNDVLNIRQKPTASSAIVGYIPPNGCGVEVRNRSGNWYRIVYGGSSGWVNGRYLTR